MKLVIKYMLLFLLMVSLGCASNPKPKYSEAELESLNTAVTQKSFEVDARWARPMPDPALTSIANAGLVPQGSTVNRINITGTSSYLRVKNDSVVADLPYYGERQMGGTYNPIKGGVHFKGLAKDFSMEPTKKDSGVAVKFSVNEGPENYQVHIQLYPSGTSNISVVSSHRTPIWYDGTWTPDRLE
jgi:hypothetical protein